MLLISTRANPMPSDMKGGSAQTICSSVFLEASRLVISLTVVGALIAVSLRVHAAEPGKGSDLLGSIDSRKHRRAKKIKTVFFGRGEVAGREHPIAMGAKRCDLTPIYLLGVGPLPVWSMTLTPVVPAGLLVALRGGVPSGQCKR